MKAQLNDEGKKVWGYIFPNGEIPVKSPFPQTIYVENRGKLEAFIVDWSALTDKQRHLILDRLASQAGHYTGDKVEEEILAHGLPLQAKFVSHVPIPMRFLT